VIVIWVWMIEGKRVGISKEPGKRLDEKKKKVDADAKMKSQKSSKCAKSYCNRDRKNTLESEEKSIGKAKRGARAPTCGSEKGEVGGRETIRLETKNWCLWGGGKCRLQ